MAIVPSREAHRAATRRRLTLDLFTRCGTFWADVDDLRKTWHVTPRTMLPPEPPFHAEAVGLVTRYQMPERFHMPIFETFNALAEPYRSLPEPYRKAQELAHYRGVVGMFLLSLKPVWRDSIPGDIRAGTNETGWMSWAPFLSACVLYDPPPGSLLEFADHDDHNAAALIQETYWRDADIAGLASAEQANLFNKRDAEAGLRALELRRESYIQVEHGAPCPTPPAGKPPLDDRECVQAAIWQRQGFSYLDIAERGNWRSDGYDARARKNKAISRVRRGKKILASREYFG